MYTNIKCQIKLSDSKYRVNKCLRIAPLYGIQIYKVMSYM